MREHVDKLENVFFMRLQTEDGNDDPALTNDIKTVLPAGAILSINPIPSKKVVVMVSKEYHCLADILVRNYFGTFGAGVQCVIGNHSNLEDICKRFDVPFFAVPHNDISKAEFETKVETIINQYNPDYIVLAKFMRILSPAVVAKFPMRIVNIHHSFFTGIYRC